MAIVLTVITRFDVFDGILIVEAAEDDVTGDLQGFQFTNTTGALGEFSAIRVSGNGRPWRDRVNIPIGSTRMNVPGNIRTLDDVDYWTSLGASVRWR